MEKLRVVIKEYSRWTPLLEVVDRIENARDLNFDLVAENSKALLESICKEICLDQKVDISKSISMNQLLKSAFGALGYSNSEMVTKISSALATIGEAVGNLRNEIGLTGHGRTLDEIRTRNEKIDLLTREFVFETVRTVAVFMVRAFEDKCPKISVPVPESLPEFGYDDFEDFNDSWDDSFGEFTMGDYSYPASQILYHVDYDAYHYERKQFEDTEIEND